MSLLTAVASEKVREGRGAHTTPRDSAPELDWWREWCELLDDGRMVTDINAKLKSTSMLGSVGGVGTIPSGPCKNRGR